MRNIPNHFPIENGTTTFGLHLMLDAYGVDPKFLNDMKRVWRYLNDLPNIIEMKKLNAPIVVDCDATATGHDPGGISGNVIIAESHISIHTFANRGFLTMDCYSCTNFSDKIENLLDYTKTIFPYENHELQVVKRGLKYPVNNLEIITSEPTKLTETTKSAVSSRRTMKSSKKHKPTNVKHKSNNRSHPIYTNPL